MYASTRPNGRSRKRSHTSTPKDSQARHPPLTPGKDISGHLLTIEYMTLRTSFVMDKHVPGLLAFHPAATFHEEASYHSGKLILQDKASCFPALVLSPDAHESMVALDATAAPGNKTTHLSAIMQNRGKVYHRIYSGSLRFYQPELMLCYIDTSFRKKPLSIRHPAKYDCQSRMSECRGIQSRLSLHGSPRK